MSEAVLKKFGKYFLLDRVGEGGMAEIFRARLATPEGSGRFIVIKRIQGEHSNNQEFVNMFKAEVQVTMRFTHPNIVQLYESGEENGQHYIAMELVDGRNLRQVLSKSAQKQMPVPIPAACQIAEQAASGLHYAHAFKDRITGEPLNLVHRDISPQNIIISYDGNVKIIDFGIAKATTNGESTRAGVIKGKLSYLSPEQVLGESLDGRSDLFALGIVLWETLTGKRLFVAEGDNEFQVLKMIESCTSFVKPPSTFQAAISKELDEIVLKALARDPRKRFQSGEEMARALRRVLVTQYAEFGPSDLSQFIKKMFHEVIVEDRKNLQTVNSRAEELIAMGLKSASEKTSTLSGAPIPRSDQTRMNDSQRGASSSPQPTRQLKISSTTGPGAGREGAGAPHSTRSVAMPRPVVVPKETANHGALKMLITAAGIGGVAYFGFQYYEKQLQARNPSSAQVQNPVKAELPSRMGKLKLQVFPAGDFAKTKVTVNAEPVSLEKGFFEVPVGEPLFLIVERPGFVTFRKEFTVQASELNSFRESSMDVKLEPMSYGVLSISTRPAVAEATIVNIDRQPAEASAPIILKTPISQEKLQAGNYRIVLKNELLGVEKVLNVEVKEGRETVMNDIQLEMKK